MRWVALALVWWLAAAPACRADDPPPDPKVLCPAIVPPDMAPQTGVPPQAGTPVGTLEILPSTRWQPVGGDVRFRLAGMAKPPENVSVYFAWQTPIKGKANVCVRSLRVRRLPDLASDDDKTYTYVARVPVMDKSAAVLPWIDGLYRRSSLVAIVPLADMYVHGSILGSDGKPVWIVLPATLGITTAWLAYLAGLLCIVVSWWLLAKWARSRNVPGGSILGIFSTPNGVASLSQFQIILWTSVIAAGVVYVMTLSGNLIDIPVTTLGLLGVTGCALVGSKLQAGIDGSPQRISAPGAVTNLVASGLPTATTAVLNWAPPAGAQQPFTYTVEMRLAGAGTWDPVAAEIGGPPYAVTGLTATTTYDFRVFAINAGGAGPAAMLTGVPTAAGAPAGAGGPGQVTGLTTAIHPEGSIELRWSPLAPAPSAYTVQYRKAGMLPWGTYSNTANTPITVAGLDRGTPYEFQVFAVGAGVAGSPSALVLASTAPRLPSWSDLVMSGDANPEIDLTRVQMLAFTSIAAMFTGLMLINTGEIPNIPVGELALVGISNGVYLASKVAGRPT